MDRGFVNDWRRRSQQSTLNTDRAKEDLFLLYCDKVERGEIEPERTDSADVVDNFYVNGQFIHRGEGLGRATEREWDEVCESAVVHNDEMACWRF